MQNDDEALPSIIPACRGHLIKMLVTLEPYGRFYSNLYLYILTLSGHRYTKRGRGFAEHTSGRLW